MSEDDGCVQRRRPTDARVNRSERAGFVPLGHFSMKTKESGGDGAPFDPIEVPATSRASVQIAHQPKGASRVRSNLAIDLFVVACR